MNEIGFVYFDQVFTNSEINRIKVYLSHFSVECTYGGSPFLGEKLDTCYVDNIPVGVNLGHYHQEVVSRCPWFYKIAHNEDLIRLVEAYLVLCPLYRVLLLGGPLALVSNRLAISYTIMIGLIFVQ